MSNQDTDLVLQLEQLGTEAAPRYKIVDPHGDFWDEQDSKWVYDGGTLYSDLNKAGEEMVRLVKLHYAHLPVREFRVPVEVVVHSQDLTQTEIEDYLLKSARLFIDTDKHGNGPKPGTLVTLRVCWDKMKEKLR